MADEKVESTLHVSDYSSNAVVNLPFEACPCPLDLVANGSQTQPTHQNNILVNGLLWVPQQYTRQVCSGLDVRLYRKAKYIHTYIHVLHSYINIDSCNYTWDTLKRTSHTGSDHTATCKTEWHLGTLIHERIGILELASDCLLHDANLHFLTNQADEGVAWASVAYRCMLSQASINLSTVPWPLVSSIFTAVP